MIDSNSLGVFPGHMVPPVATARRSRTAGFAAGLFFDHLITCACLLVFTLCSDFDCVFPIRQVNTMSTGNAQGQNYDARVYTVCAPWLGKRGDPFLRVFEPAFLNGLEAVIDDWDNLKNHLEGKRNCVRRPFGRTDWFPRNCGVGNGLTVMCV